MRPTNPVLCFSCRLQIQWNHVDAFVAVVFPAATSCFCSPDINPIDSCPFDASPFCNVPTSCIAFVRGGHLYLAVPPPSTSQQDTKVRNKRPKLDKSGTAEAYLEEICTEQLVKHPK